LGWWNKGEDRVLYFDESELLEWSIVSMGSNPKRWNAKPPRWKKLKVN
jgi:hypothetical protein